jgi:hypothetical protein
LSWFQLGGKRWFATAVAAFLTKMHNDIDLSATEAEKVHVKGTRREGKEYPIWNPTNRRLQLPL